MFEKLLEENLKEIFWITKMNKFQEEFEKIFSKGGQGEPYKVFATFTKLGKILE